MMTNRRLLGSLIAMALTAALAGCGGAQPPKAPAESAPVTAPSTVPVSAPTDANTPVAQNPSAPVSSPVNPPGPKPPATGGAVGGAPAAGTNPTAVAPTPPPAPREVAQVEVLAVTPLGKGAYSGVTERKVVLVTDEQAWQALWKQHASRNVPPPAAPAIDFSTASVLAVYMGEQRTGGYSVEVTRVQKENGVLTVTVRESRPGPGTITTMALTQPYHLVAIPKVAANTTLNVQWQ